MTPRRRTLRPVGGALETVTERLAPPTTLAAVQRVWADVAGAALAAQAAPVAERDGVLTVACRSSVWASELDLLSEQVLARLEHALGARRIVRLRVTATGSA